MWASEVSGLSPTRVSGNEIGLRSGLFGAAAGDVEAEVNADGEADADDVRDEHDGKVSSEFVGDVDVDIGDVEAGGRLIPALLLTTASAGDRAADGDRDSSLGCDAADAASEDVKAVDVARGDSLAIPELV